MNRDYIFDLLNQQIAKEQYANQGDKLRAYLETIMARGEARNGRLQQIAEIMASVVTLMNKFQ